MKCHLICNFYQTPIVVHVKIALQNGTNAAIVDPLVAVNVIKRGAGNVVETRTLAITGHSSVIKTGIVVQKAPAAVVALYVRPPTTREIVFVVVYA
jgi:hypothetical protein